MSDSRKEYHERDRYSSSNSRGGGQGGSYGRGGERDQGFGGGREDRYGGGRDERGGVGGRGDYKSGGGSYNNRDRDGNSRDRQRDRDYERDGNRGGGGGDYGSRRGDRDYHDNSERDFDRAKDRRDYNQRDAPGKHHDTLLRDPIVSADSDKSPDTIYISNLPQTVTEASLARFFGTVGIVKNDKKTGNPKVWIYKDKSTGLPKGDATVTFEDPSASDGAISWFDNKQFEGKTIKVEKAQAPKPPPGGWNAKRGGRGGGRGGGGRW